MTDLKGSENQAGILKSGATPSAPSGGAGNATPNGKRVWQLFGMRRGQDGQSSLKPEDRQEWKQVQKDLLKFEQNQDQGAQLLEVGSAIITTSHWVKNSDRSHCHNKSCKRPLWAMSKHHCRKCGEIFCAKCLQYYRRLSPNAAYDPSGLRYKVCEACFSSKQQGIGVTRRWTDYLDHYRKEIHKKDETELTRAAILRTCKNLTTGFQTNSVPGTPTPSTPQTTPSTNGSQTNGKAGVGNPLKFFKRNVSKVVKWSVPDWQKSPNWVNEGTKCQCCDRPYGYLETQHNCRICGKLVCKAQSSKDLLVYTPDKSDRAELGSEARWAIICVIGCPEVEPDHSLLLRVCKTCKGQLEAIQVEEQRKLEEEGAAVYLCWQGLVGIHANILTIQAKIDGSMPEFQKLIDGLEIQAGAPKSLPPNRNNMQLLAKHQGDLADHLSAFVVTIARLKQLRPQTKSQCKVGFYSDKNNLYKKLKRQLEEITPQDVLMEIQSLVDAKAINSACLSLNQIAFECLHLCMKYKLNQSLPLAIKQTAEACEADLEKKITSDGEDWAEHKRQLDAFVRLQIKGDAENNIKARPYIRPSRRMTKRGGAVYVEFFLNQRVEEVATKIRIQLVGRTADRSFRRTKESLEGLLTDLKEPKLGDGDH
ncbi:uncharacterized protein [Diadema setosum]|uniref:uncharacterized protein n=1 Tax=Diadema setosum TaxID=31175 RepID=UPI003B3A047F